MTNAVAELFAIKNQERAEVIRFALNLQQAIDAALPATNRPPLPAFEDIDPTRVRPDSEPSRTKRKKLRPGVRPDIFDEDLADNDDVIELERGDWAELFKAKRRKAKQKLPVRTPFPTEEDEVRRPEPTLEILKRPRIEYAKEGPAASTSLSRGTRLSQQAPPAEPVNEKLAVRRVPHKIVKLKEPSEKVDLKSGNDARSEQKPEPPQQVEPAEEPLQKEEQVEEPPQEAEPAEDSRQKAEEPPRRAELVKEPPQAKEAKEKEPQQNQKEEPKEPETHEEAEQPKKPGQDEEPQGKEEAETVNEPEQAEAKAPGHQEASEEGQSTAQKPRGDEDAKPKAVESEDVSTEHRKDPPDRPEILPHRFAKADGDRDTPSQKHPLAFGEAAEHRRGYVDRQHAQLPRI
jgi:hypothetical protein